jgi:hypothetical protein
MIALIIVTIALLVFSYFAIRQDNNLFFVVPGGLAATGGVFLLIGIGISSFYWVGAEYKARIINREYGTEYTREEVFYASDVIETIRELDRKRIELNGNIMGNKLNVETN